MRTRTKQIPIRVSEKELETIERKADKCGLNREAYLRECALGVPLKEQPSADLKEVISQLRRIGINIQQVAVKANTSGLIDEPLYRQNYTELQSVIGKIMEVIF